MIRPNREQLEAMVRLSTNPDFEIFLGYLADRAEDNNKSLVMKNHERSGQMYTLQGQTRELVTLMETIHEAHSELKKLTTQREAKA